MLKPEKDKLLASIFTNSPGLVNLWAKTGRHRHEHVDALGNAGR